MVGRPVPRYERKATARLTAPGNRNAEIAFNRPRFVSQRSATVNSAHCYSIMFTIGAP